MSEKSKKFDDLARELIKEYSIKKNKIIKEYLDKDIYFINNDDLDEIDGWPTRYLLRTLGNITIYNDLSICPWCINFRCANCKYGERHGICSKPRSTYREIVNYSSILNIKGMLRIVKWFRKRSNKLMERLCTKIGEIEL